MDNSEGRDQQEKERIHLLSEEVTILRRMRSELPDKIRRLEIDRNALLQIIREKDERIAALEKQTADFMKGCETEPETFHYLDKTADKSSKKTRGASR